MRPFCIVKVWPLFGIQNGNMPGLWDVVTPERKGEKKRSLRDIRVQRAKIPTSQASLGLTSSVPCSVIPFLIGSAKK